MLLCFFTNLDVPSSLRRNLALAAGALTLAACGGGDEFPGVNDCTNGLCGNPQTTAGDGSVPSGSTSGTTGGTTGFTSGSTGSTSTGGTSTGDTTTGTAPASGMPCDVEEAVTEKCGLCHGSTPMFGAPMSLTSWDDFQAATPSDAAVSVAEKAAERIHGDTSTQMPPVDQPPLTADELAALDQWLQTGTPQSQEQCGGGPNGVTDTDGGMPDPVTDIPNLKCFKVTAHAQGNKEEGYPVGAATDEYVNFHFMPPWGFKLIS